MTPELQHPQYAITGRSVRFPDQKSLMGTLLNNLLLIVVLENKRVSTGDSGPDDGPGKFEVDLRKGESGNIEFLYNYDNDSLELHAFNIPVDDQQVARAGKYSLVDFFPGFVAVSPTTGVDLCDDLHQTDTKQCDQMAADLNKHLRVETFDIRFPYAKSLHLANDTASSCQTDQESYLVFSTPDDVEQINSSGRIAGKKILVSREACSAFDQSITSRGASKSSE
jgi:hypothetical protein